MAYCTNCGKMLGDGASFCSSCGQAVSNSSTGGLRPNLVRPRAGRKIAGVCKGIANHLGWDVTLLRVITVILAIVTFPLGIIAYLIFWLVVPEEPLALPPAASIQPQ